MTEPRKNPVEVFLESTPLRLTFFFTLILLTVAPIFSVPRNGGATLDWQFFQFFEEIARKTILHYHQLPIWNPYFCGGTTMIGNPQTTFLVPTFPLVLVFGATLGMRLSIIAVILVSCEGGYRLGRQLGLGALASVFVGLTWSYYGHTWGWLHDGQYGLQGMTLATWVLYGYLRGLERPVYLALGAAFFAWMLAYRGIQPGPQLALGLGIWSLLEARRRFIDKRPLVEALWPVAACAILGVLAFAYVGVRMVPVLQEVLAHPRVIGDERVWTFTEVLFEIFLLPYGTRGFPSSGYSYLGAVGFSLFVAAVFFAGPRKRAAIPLFVALSFLLLMLGPQGSLSPYALLHRLPLYKSLRNPALFSFTGALFLVIGAGFALDELLRWAANLRRGARVATALVTILTLSSFGDLFVQARHATTDNFLTFGAIPRVADEFRQTRGNDFQQPIWPYLDRGSIACYDETPWPTSSELRSDLPAEEYLADASAGTVRRVRWTPNRIDLHVELARPATLLVNQNWSPGWHASTGKLRSANGLVAVDLPAGTTELTLSVWPLGATAGVLLMLAAIAVTVWLVRRDRRLQANRH
jgi:hypothetical protein